MSADNYFIIRDFKKFTSKAIVKIIAEPHEYLFSSARDYSGEKGFVYVQTEI
jgi:hypothetical protein